MKDFLNIKAWRRAHELTLKIYKVCESFPKEELYGLTSQIRRAAGSIPTNIAEGCGRSTDVELARFVDIALGSASEVEYHLLLARDLGYIAAEYYEALNSEIIEIKRMLTTFAKTVRKTASRKPVKADS